MKTYIMICDARRARLFERSDRNESLNLIQEFSHEASRKKASDVNSDRPGRISKKYALLPIDASESPKRHAAEQFAQELASVLNEQALRDNQSSFAIVAPPHFLGQLKSALSPVVSKGLIVTLNDDLTWANEGELQHRLSDLWKMIAAAEVGSR